MVDALETNKIKKDYEVVVYGTTPSGIAAAISAARLGRTVALVGAGKHVGGLMSSGLSITDLRFTNAFGGIFKEYVNHIFAHYREEYGAASPQAEECKEGLWFEPHVSEAVFDAMLANEGERLTLYRNYRLMQPILKDKTVMGVTVRSRETGIHLHLGGRVVIDATYEGDLAAASGVRYHIGRESRKDFWEPYAGFIFLRQPGLEVLAGSTGEGDGLIQAYNYRLCLTNREDIRVLPEKPEHYNREEYVSLLREAEKGGLKCMNDLIRLAPIPNGKFNGNNRPISRSLDLPEVNTGYPEGDEEKRQRIVEKYRDYMLGLLWFIQNDAELPEELKNETRQWGFCRDEFADNGYIPYALYVREARRIAGKKTFTAHDAFLAPGMERTPIHEDSIGVGDYHVDSHLVQRKKDPWPQHEGHVYLRALSKPAQIPYGIMVPEETEGLLVSGAVSATHLGFSVLRMEPPWMAIGSAAGTAAHLAMEENKRLSDINIAKLQQLLLRAGQVISFFYDVPGPDPIWFMLNKPGEKTKLDHFKETDQYAYEAGIQYFGTRGFFSSYYARPKDPLTRYEAADWLYKYALLDGICFDNKAGRHFDDVKAGHPLYEAIHALSAYGIMESWLGSGGFCGGAAVSRTDAVRSIFRIKQISKGWIPEEAPKNRWEDVSRSSKGYAEITTLLHKGVLPAGWCTQALLTPDAFITREELCELMYLGCATEITANPGG